MINTFDELMRAILEILPEAQLLEDSEGELVIYTNLRDLDGEGNLASFE